MASALPAIAKGVTWVAANVKPIATIASTIGALVSGNKKALYNSS